MKTNTGRRGVSVLLILAMLIVSVAALVPVAASAAPEEDYAGDIKDFTFQTLSDANQDDTQTDLRFLFSIGSLEYDAVGFVFSKDNSAPTAGATNTFSTTTVYRSVTADGNENPAPTGRYWVAVKLSEIPLADFESTIYVRPFIKEGDDYSYVDAKSITVCEALTFDKTVAGESSVYNSKSPAGIYASSGSFRFEKTIADIRGTDHFCPDASNGNAGNDLWFEYSILWNDSMNNYDVYNCASEIKAFGFLHSNYSVHSEFYLLYGMDYADRTGDNKGKDGDECSPDCKFRGHFDYSTYKEGYGSGKGYKCADDLTSLGNTLFGDAVGLYKAGWSGARNQSPYIYDNNNGTIKGGNGWHRLGFRFHQEVESVSGSTVTYSGYSELYINGTLVWRVHSNMSTLESKDLLLWTATAADGVITGYADNDTMRVQYRMDQVASSSNAVYVGISDIQYTCGDGFVRQVSPASLYPDREITLGNTDCSGEIWYVFDNPDN